jgi:ribonuclease R
MDLSLDHLMHLFEQTPGRPVPMFEILEHVGAPYSRQETVLALLMRLVQEGRLVRLRRKYFTLSTPASRRAEGRLHVSVRGKGFLIGVGEDGEDVLIQGHNLGTALDGDTVEAELYPGGRGREEGRVLEVLRRAHEHIVGQFTRIGPSSGFLMPRNTRIGRAIEVRKAPPKSELPDNAWVRTRVAEWSNSIEEPLIVEIEEFLGLPGEQGLAVLALLRDLNVDVEFPEEVERETERFAAPASAAELARRRDLRGLRIVTIDPATAKDFDDALSIEKLGDGLWRLGVHIADVAQYVTEDTALDAEALRRSTSIYPVDRVVPMLPERLSNDLCSLRPDEDRYALSCFMDINRAGDVTRYELAESVIRSRHRLNYGEVQEFFDESQRRDEFAFADVANDLIELREVARALNRMRMERGALDLDMPEKKIVCNESGDVLELLRSERFESHRLVEECMLIANETVACHMRQKELPVLYRIHEVPDPNSLAKLAPALSIFGVQMPTHKFIPTPALLQPMVARMARLDGGHIGQYMLLRGLMRARYWPENRGHFGLASTCYCHFTSPIRRYPDLLTHRVLKDALQGKTKEPNYLERFTEEAVEKIADTCNAQAEWAEDVERQAETLKALEFMREYVGGVFEGWIAGITRKGFFVELIDYPVEGYVDARTIEDDQYEPDEHRVRMVGRYTRRMFRLAQRVKVRVLRVREIEGEMDLELVQEPWFNKSNRPSKRQRRERRG